MTNTSGPESVMMNGTTMIDRAHTEDTLYRVAVSAFTYYPGKETAEPGYRVQEDIDWCAQPLRDLPAEQRDEIRERIRIMITDPLADRQGFITVLSALADQ